MGAVQNSIKENAYKSAYLLYGSEAYLRNYYKNALKNALVNEGDTLNYSYFEGPSTNVLEVVDLLQTMPFMAEHRVVIVENSGWLSKAGGSDGEENTEDTKNGNKDQFSMLTDAIKNLSEDTVIIFVEEKADKRSKIYKTITQKGIVEEYAEQTDDQLARWLTNMAKASGKTMSPQAAYYLVNECGKDMLLLTHEMEKLTAWALEKPEITEADIDTVCTHQINNKIFDMISAIAVHRQKEALKLYYDLLTLRESPFHILTLMVRQYTQMLAIKDGMLRNEPAALTGSKIGMQDWLAKKTADQVRRMDIKEIRKNLEACAKADEDIKNGNIVDNMSVELLIISCSMS